MDYNLRKLTDEETLKKILYKVRHGLHPPKMSAPVREGNKLYCMAFPCNMKEYLNAANEKMKLRRSMRY